MYSTVRFRVLTYTSTLGSLKITSTLSLPQIVPQGPQLLTVLLVQLQDAIYRGLIDQTAIDFAFLNLKAARKCLIKVRILAI